MTIEDIEHALITHMGLVEMESSERNAIINTTIANIVKQITVESFASLTTEGKTIVREHLSRGEISEAIVFLSGAVPDFPAIVASAVADNITSNNN